MREEAAVPPPPTRRRRVLSWALLVIGGALIGLTLFGGATLALLGLGAILLFIAIALLSPRLVPPIAGAVGYPLERLRGVAGRLARENALRNPSRTAVTAAALMIGLALVTFVSVLAAGAKASIDDTVSKDMKAQFVVQNKDGFNPISPETGQAMKRVPGVQTVSPLNTSEAKVDGVGSHPFGSGIDPATFDKVWNLHIDKGPPNVLSALPPRGIVLEKNWADDNGFDLGDTVKMTTPRRQQGGSQGVRDVRGQGWPRGRLRRSGPVDQAGLRPARRLVRVRGRPARRGPEGGAGAGRPGAGGAVPDRRGAEPEGVPGQHHRPGGPVPVPDLRAAVAVGDRLAVRDREHAGAVDPRAHARDRDDARDRHVRAASCGGSCATSR